MAQAGATVTCVDHWQGNVNDGGCKAYDGSAGSPYEVFLRNTSDLREQGKIRVFRGSSAEAAEFYADKQFDIVYIDAEHDYDSVKRDIELWKPRARHIIAGHDYLAFHGVKEAVDAALGPPASSGNVWHVKL